MYISAGSELRNQGADEIAAGSRAPTQQQTAMEEEYLMYVPPFNSLLTAIGITREDFESSTTVTIPAELFRLLLKVTVATSDFNLEGYLRSNPDVAEAIQHGSPDDARMHYVGFGFFEGRAGATPEVDETWYLRTYADVADGIKAGKTTSGAAHFRDVGASEGRSPNARYTAAAEQWKRALRLFRD